MVNFDNSAGSFPKPARVRLAVNDAIRRFGGNPGRGGHKLSMASGEQVYRVRKKAAQLFAAQPENIAFVPNCTFGLNMAIKGLMKYGGHIIISSFEHNACARPVYALTRQGIKCSVAQVSSDTEKTVKNFERLIRSDTRCICCIAASNVTGRILPFRELGRLCKKQGIPLIVDAAQASGVLDITVGEGISFICTSGQKGLYGPTGTGLLISSGEYSLATIIEGGTGATSGELEQTPYMPEKLESGSLNTAGIIGLGAGIDFVRATGIEKIRSHETMLCRQFEKGLGELGARIYDEDCPRVPITAFGFKSKTSEEVAKYLSDCGFALRGGLHCAALAHESLGTTSTGLVRFSPSAFNDSSQVNALLGALRGLTKA